MQLFPDVQKSAAVFGREAIVYGPLVNNISPYIFREKYTFEDVQLFQQKLSDAEFGLEYGTRTYWTEILGRAHLAAVTSMVRTCRWVDLAVCEFERRNIFGWASACRGLIEAAGDSSHSLGGVPLTLAQMHVQIKEALAGKAKEFHVSGELEDALIHYSHARKIRKNESAPESHKAKQSAEYLRFLTDMKIDGIRELYAHLCEIIHPAAMSVSLYLALTEDGWTMNLENETALLEAEVAQYRELLGSVLMAAFNPPILILRVLHTFDLFTKITPLRKYHLDRIPLWSQIEKALR